MLLNQSAVCAEWPPQALLGEERETSPRLCSQRVFKSYQTISIPCENSARKAGTEGPGGPRGELFCWPQPLDGDALSWTCLRHTPGAAPPREPHRHCPARANVTPALALVVLTRPQDMHVSKNQ